MGFIAKNSFHVRQFFGGYTLSIHPKMYGQLNVIKTKK